MNLHKQVTATALLLMLFATVGAALVGLTHDTTAEQIERNHQQLLLRRLNTIMPPDSYDNDLLASTVTLRADPLLGLTQDATAYLATRQGKPVGVVLPAVAPNGYNGSIHLLVGIYADGRIAGVRITGHRETPGLGDAIESSRSDWITGFNGKSLTRPDKKKWKVKRDGGVFDQFTGATISPRAVVKAVYSALVYFDRNRENLFNPVTRKHA